MEEEVPTIPDSISAATLEQLWEKRTGKRLEAGLELSRKNWVKLLSFLSGPEEVALFVRDSVEAWIWARRGEENPGSSNNVSNEIPPFYLNSTINSESNARRVEVYREKKKESPSSIQRGYFFDQTSQIMLTQQDYLLFLIRGNFPSPELLGPSPHWLISQQLLRGKYHEFFEKDLPDYFKKYWEGIPLGRYLSREVPKLVKNKNLRENYLRRACLSYRESYLSSFARERCLISLQGFEGEEDGKQLYRLLSLESFLGREYTEEREKMGFFFIRKILSLGDPGHYNLAQKEGLFCLFFGGDSIAEKVGKWEEAYATISNGQNPDGGLSEVEGSEQYLAFEMNDNEMKLMKRALKRKQRQEGDSADKGLEVEEVTLAAFDGTCED